MTERQAGTCVFCGRPITDDEPAAGRPPAAAHAACADRALTDDRHWDAIAASSGEPIDEPAAGDPAPAGRRAGCLTMVLIVGVVIAVLRRSQSRR